MAPDAATVNSACAELGVTAAGAGVAAPGEVDGLAAWLATRGRCFAPFGEGAPREQVMQDGHLRFIEGRERERDAARAERMAAALRLSRVDADAGGELTFEQLARWQSVVLGRGPVAFRRNDAFAKDGRERYPYDATVEGRLRAALRDATDPDTPVWVRASRVYLDICFFHPFEDGNARSARLSLDYVLTRAGLGLFTMEPIVLLPRDPADGRGAWCFSRLVDHLARMRA